MDHDAPRASLRASASPPLRTEGDEALAPAPSEQSDSYFTTLITNWNDGTW